MAETCPASSLKQLGLYRPYKGRGDALRDWRKAILDRLREEGLVCDDGLEEAAIADIGGDALDSIIAAATMWRVAHDPETILAARDGVDALEARVFAWAGKGID